MNKHVIPPYLLGIRPELEKHLIAIQNLLPDPYRLTLVARHTSNPDAYITLTDDYPLEDVATVLMRSDIEDKAELGAKVHLKSDARDAIRKILFDFEIAMHGHRVNTLSQEQFETKAHRLLEETTTLIVAREELIDGK